MSNDEEVEFTTETQVISRGQLYLLRDRDGGGDVVFVATSWNDAQQMAALLHSCELGEVKGLRLHPDFKRRSVLVRRHKNKCLMPKYRMGAGEIPVSPSPKNPPTISGTEITKPL